MCFMYAHSTYVVGMYIIECNLFSIHDVSFKFNITKLKLEMGREPKHSFVAWLEFIQKVVKKTEDKKTHLPKDCYQKKF